MIMYSECQRKDYLEKFGNEFRQEENKKVDLELLDGDLGKGINEKRLDALEWEVSDKWSEKIVL